METKNSYINFNFTKVLLSPYTVGLNYCKICDFCSIIVVCSETALDGQNTKFVLSKMFKNILF